METFMHEIDRMTRRQQRNFILSVGGKIGFIKGIMSGGTGIGGLILKPEKNPWWQFTEFAQVSCSFEKMNEVLMLRLNNTKRNIAIPIPYRSIETIRTRVLPDRESKREELELLIRWKGGPDLILENRGWNNRALADFFSTPPLKTFFHADHTTG